MKRLSLQQRIQVLPALHGRPVEPAHKPARAQVRLTFDHRASRHRRFPLEQSLAGIPGPPRLGRYLDIEV